MNGRRVVVTGCCGFIGHNLVGRLLARGASVLGVDDLSHGSRENTEARIESLGGSAADRFELRVADVAEPATARGVALWNADTVVHLAARHFIPECEEHPELVKHSNLLGTQALLLALSSSPPKRLVFASSAAVYAPSRDAHVETETPDPIDGYGKSKAEGETMIRTFADAHGSSPAILRLFNVYGPGDPNPHLVPAILGQVTSSQAAADLSAPIRIRIGNLDPARDYVHVDDVAGAFMQAIDSDAPLLANVGTGRIWSVAEVLDVIAAASARALDIEQVPELMRPTDRPILRADTTRAAAVLGFSTTVAFPDGIAALLTRPRS